MEDAELSRGPREPKCAISYQSIDIAIAFGGLIR